MKFTDTLADGATDGATDEPPKNETCILCIEEGAGAIDTPCANCRITMHRDCFDQFCDKLPVYSCPICRTEFLPRKWAVRQSTIVPLDVLETEMEETSPTVVQQIVHVCNSGIDETQCVKLIHAVVLTSLIWVIGIMYFTGQNVFGALVVVLILWVVVLVTINVIFAISRGLVDIYGVEL